MMKKINNLCVITNLFPPFPNKTSGMFLQNLLVAFSSYQISCTVIRPVSITKGLFRKRALPPYKVIEEFEGTSITVYSPRYISVGDRNPILYGLSYRMKEITAKRTFKKIDDTFDALYSHFFTSGRTALALGQKKNLAVFVAHGESDFSSQFDILRKKVVQDFYQQVSGVVAVSSHIKRHILENVSIDSEKITVEPNGTNTAIFHPMDKLEVRKRLQILPDTIVVIYVGTMIERKGPRRLAQALNGLEHVHGYFIGKGKESLPESELNIHLCGEKTQNEVVEYLNAGDMFVLPTLAEGSSNVIVEALACGLPVISSDRDFNEDILDESCSILVDPTDTKQIRKAIVRLADDKALRNRMSLAALERAKQLDLHERAKRILSFMENRI